MYDMTRVTANGYNDKEDSKEARDAKRLAMSAQRTLDFKNGQLILSQNVELYS